MSKPSMFQRRTILKGACYALSAMPALGLSALVNQNTTLCGRLVDPQGRPIVGAKIDFPNQLQALTDADGRFFVITSTAWPSHIMLSVQGTQPASSKRVLARLSQAHGDLRWFEIERQDLSL